MKKRINKQLIIMGVMTVIFTWLFALFTFYQYYEKKINNDLMIATNAIISSYKEENSIDYLSNINLGNYRITLIDTKGNVLYDSQASVKSLKNHLERPEFQKALKDFEGNDVRRSETMNLKTHYYAKKINDDMILRISLSSNHLFENFNQLVINSIFLVAFVLLLSILISKKLTNQIMKPIYKMGRNIDNIEENIPYKELEPFVNHIKQHQDKKRENEKIRREFTANVSHELKTPLTSISGYAELMENGLVKDEDIKEFAGKIHSESGRLLNLIRDIIKLSEIDEPTKTINCESVDVYKIALDIKEYLEFYAKQNEITIDIEGENPFYVLGDKTLLNELIYNLCDNAIKYNKHGGSVVIKFLYDENKPVISIKDTGIGIAKSEHSRIFERFYRVDKSRSKETGGTGLGLGIVKHIAMQHDAEIEIFSEVDKGTEIKIVFSA